MCKYSGIYNFPWDRPSCRMEIGGWQLSHAYQGLRSVSVLIPENFDGVTESERAARLPATGQ